MWSQTYNPHCDAQSDLKPPGERTWSHLHQSGEALRGYVSHEPSWEEGAQRQFS